jgi:uncharacterized membrane protein YdjX (TVP38/TMEM64 family)
MSNISWPAILGAVMAVIGSVFGGSDAPHAWRHSLNTLRIVAMVVLFGLSAYLLTTHRQLFENPNVLRNEVVSWGAWAPIVYMIMYAIGPSFLVPGAVMTIAAGLAFGAWWGSIWSIVGADVGAMVAFGAGRFLGRPFIERTLGTRLRPILSRLERNGFYLTLYLRLVPLIPYNAFNLIAGASPIRFKDYFWASIIGMIPGTVLFALLGDSLWKPGSPRFFVALSLIVCCFAAVEAYRRRTAEPLI